MGCSRGHSTVAHIGRDLLTGSIGLIETAGKWFLPGPMPKVRLTPVRTDGGTECLEFAFSSLPENFALGNIHLRILDSTGPTRLSGDMSAEIVRVLVNKEISAGRSGRSHGTDRVSCGVCGRKGE